MLKTNDMSRKNMMLELRHSFSVKSFSLKSYQSSLICNRKSFRLNVNLINGLVLNSTKDSFVSKYAAKNFGNMTKNNREASSQDDQNFKNSKYKNKFLESSSFVKKSSKELSSFGDSPRSLVEDRDPQRSLVGDRDSPRSLVEARNSPRFLVEDQDSLRSLVEDRDSPRSLVEYGDSPRSSIEDEKSNLNIPVETSYKVKKSNSLNAVRTTNQNSSEGKSFRCEVCMKFFSSKYNVKRHSVLHSLERHACNVCRKEFQTKENLKRHCRAIHELRVKSIACSKCYKAFSRELDLKIHLKKHPDHVQ